MARPKTKPDNVHRLTIDLPEPLMGFLKVRRDTLGASYQRTVEMAVEAFACCEEANRLQDPALQERARVLLGEILTGVKVRREAA